MALERIGRALLALVLAVGFVLFALGSLLHVLQGRLGLAGIMGACTTLLLIAVLIGKLVRPPAGPASAPAPAAGPSPAPAPVGPAAPSGTVPPSRFGTAEPGSAAAAAEPQPRFAPVPPPDGGEPAGRFSAQAAPSLFGGRSAPRELTPLRSTTVASLATERAEPAPPAAAPADTYDGDRRWGSPAAPGSATQVLPQRRRVGRGRVPAPRQVPLPPPGAPVDGQPARAAVVPPAEPGAEPVGAATRLPAAASDATPAPAASSAATTPLPGPVSTPAPTKVDLTPRPGDPAVGIALLAPAREKLRELEPPLVRSWLTLLDAGQRGEPTPSLKAGQLAVLAAGLEDAAVRRRLLRAVADPLVDAVGLVTQDLPLDGLSAAAAPAGRVATARELLLLVARTTTGTPAQGAAVRAVKWLDRPAG